MKGISRIPVEVRSQVLKYKECVGIVLVRYFEENESRRCTLDAPEMLVSPVLSSMFGRLSKFYFVDNPSFLVQTSCLP